MLPIYQDESQNLMLLQTNWASQINPVLSQPWTQALLLNSVALINGSTTVNHKLGRKLQGWIIVGQNAVASIYDAQASNIMPDKTLTLVSNAAVTVNLMVF